MKDRLIQELHATYVEIIDDSAKHAGHAGAMGGGGHYRIVVVAPCFEGLSPVERHQKVYAVFKEDIPSRIHALSIKALTSGEERKNPEK
jgi:BolA protein